MDIYTKLRNGEYKPMDIKYPERPLSACNICGNPGILKNKPFCPSCGGKHDYEQRMDKYREAKGEYQGAVVECEDRFHVDLADYCETSNHPKEQLLFEKAWERGHSYGLSEVAQIYEDLAELIL